MWRNALVALLAVILLPVYPYQARAQNDGGNPDCDAVYTERFASWITYFSTGQGQPIRPDRDSPCFDVELQAQGDAFAVRVPSQPPSDPAPPVVTPIPISTSATPQVVASDPSPVPPSPTAPPQIDFSQRLDVVAASIQLSDVPNGYARRNWETTNGREIISHLALYTRSGLGSGPFLITSMVMTSTNTGQPIPGGSIEELTRGIAGLSTQLTEVMGPSIGDSTRWLTGPIGSASAPGFGWFALFTIGNNAALVGTGYQTGRGAQTDVIPYAQLVAERMRGGAASGATVTTIPSAAISSPSQTATSRVDGLKGQTSRLCGLGTTFNASVFVAVESDGDWIGLLLDATNTGLRSEDLYLTAQLRDQRGRLFDMASSSTFPLYSTVLRGLQQQQPTLNIVSQSSSIQPGRSAMVLVFFRVAPDSTALTLVPNEVLCR
jgi:hypothetical protein